MQNLTKQIILAITACLILNACGTKGPLYIPEKQYPQPTQTSR